MAEKENSKALSSEELNGAEQSTPTENDDSLGKGYTGDADGSSPKKKSRVSRLKGNLAAAAGNKKVVAGGGIGATLVTIAIVGFFAAASQKIESLVTDLQDHFFSSSENAVQDESDSLLAGYFKKILPSYKKCNTSTIDRNCHVYLTDTGLVGNLYKAWSNARLENVLASKYGIELQWVPRENAYYLKAPGTDSGFGDKLASDADGTPDIGSIENEFDKSNRTEIRSTINNALKNETAWKQVMYRYKVGRMLEEKYGIKRCIIACGSVRDPLADFAAAQKNAMKVYLVQRVITPRNSAVGAVLECLLTDTCNTTEKSTDTPANPCSDDCELAGGAESPEEGTIRTTLTKLATNYGITDKDTIQGMIDAYNKISESGYSNYALNTLLKKLGINILADNDTDEVPILDVVNWINQASIAINSIATAGPKLKILSYAINSSADVSMFEMYRTYADEAKTGHSNATEYGSFVNALGPGDQPNTVDTNKTNDTEVGGSSGAEGTPLYSSIIDGDPNANEPTGTTAYNSFMDATTYAASDNSSPSNTVRDQYLCSDGNTVPLGSLVCPEEVLGGGNKYVSDISNALNTYPFSVVTQISGFLHSTLGKVYNYISDVTGWVFGILTHVPGVSSVFNSLTGLITSVIKPFENWAVTKLIPDPFGSDQSGGRTFDEMAAGADVSGNLYAHNGIGGVALTPVQSAQITSQQESEQKQEFQSQPIMTRLFSSSDPYSLMSRFADALPFGTTGYINSISSIFTDPFSGIAHSFSSITNRYVNADSAQPDPFGVTQYGYPDGTIPTDPETYWQQHCTDNSNVDWTQLTMNYNNAGAATTDSVSGEPENLPNPSMPNDGTDPCLLIQAAVGDDGAVYNENLLTPDDLGDLNNTGDTTSTSAATNNNLYMVGDSLTVGMESGGIQADLAAKGYNVTKIEATVGDSVATALPKVQADNTYLNNAGTVVVELGTNDCSLSGTPSCESTQEFEGQIENMVSAIRSADASAQIYWVNIYTNKGPVYTSINQALTAESGPLNYKIIDWANEATTNPSKYSFDSELGVHQTTTAGYQNMAAFVSGQLSAAPTNAVAQAIFGNKTQSPSFLSTVGDVFSKLVSSIDTVNKKQAYYDQ